MKKYTYEIMQDNSPESPREWDNFGTMICFHKRYNLGDEHPYDSGEFDGWDGLKMYLIEECGAKVILPLYLYDHSGITMSTSSFNCNWDSGQVGFIYCTEKDMESNGMGGKMDEDRAITLLKGEVETYDQYLRGDVYGYRVFLEEECDMGHIHKTELDSCWGYYGEEEAENEAKSIVEYYNRVKLAV